MLILTQLMSHKTDSNAINLLFFIENWKIMENAILGENVKRTP